MDGDGEGGRLDDEDIEAVGKRGAEACPEVFKLELKANHPHELVPGFGKGVVAVGCCGCVGVAFFVVALFVVALFVVALFVVAVFVVALFVVVLFVVVLFAVALFFCALFYVVLFVVVLFAVALFFCALFVVVLFVLVLFVVALFVVVTNTTITPTKKQTNKQQLTWKCKGVR